MKETLCVCLFTVLSLIIGCNPVNEGIVKRSKDADAEREFQKSSSGDETLTASKLPVLDPSTRQIICSYGETIRKYSSKYGFDWRLTLAIMKAESNFLDTAESHRGASGLMQIMPETQEELARALDIENITEPQSNIRAGIFYLSRVNRMFQDGDEGDRTRLTLAAYNAGPGRVFDAQDVAKYLNNDPSCWQSVKDALPLLSKRYYTLHHNIWPNRKPKSGAFKNPHQTIAYVERIMDYYDEYRLVLN